ncbi:MAG: hypothetical protein V1790_19160 [Planctomycetota bacterium]
MAPSQRYILSVIGPHSGCGKSLFVLHLLRHIHGLGCLKISPTYEWPGSIHEFKEGAGPDFQFEDRACLSCAGKDTAAYLAAGAAHVERLRHRANGLAAGLGVALDRFRPQMPIVVESSSAVPLLRPAVVVLIVRPPLREMKPATHDVLSMVTDLLMNVSGHAVRPTAGVDGLLDAYEQIRPRFIWSADLSCEPPPAQMLHRVRETLEAARGGHRDS